MTPERLKEIQNLSTITEATIAVERKRVDPPRRLPTMGMKPKQIMEDKKMIGMFESKQDLYLLIAWLSNRVSDLEDKLGIK